MVVMARVLAPYGIQGWIKARPYTASIAALLEYTTWWLAPARDADAWREFAVRSAALAWLRVFAEPSGCLSLSLSVVCRARGFSEHLQQLANQRRRTNRVAAQTFDFRPIHIVQGALLEELFGSHVDGFDSRMQLT